MKSNSVARVSDLAKTWITLENAYCETTTTDNKSKHGVPILFPFFFLSILLFGDVQITNKLTD